MSAKIVVRIQAENLIVARDRLLPELQIVERVGAVVQRGDVRGIDRERAIETLDRFARPSELLKDRSAVAPNVDIPGHPSNGAIVTRERVFVPPRIAQGLAVIVVRDRVFRSESDRLPDQRDGDFVIAPLRVEHTERMQGVGIFWIGREDAAKEVSGLVPLARPLQAPSLLQPLCDVAGAGVHCPGRRAAFCRGP